MTSCQSASVPDSPQGAARAGAAAQPVPDIAPRPNPAQRQRYALTLRFSGLPGEISQFDGTADFEVENRDCVPMDYSRAVGGVRLPPQHSVHLDLRRVDGDTFVATLFADAVLDEDYFGLGVCHWTLNSATVHFRSPATHFVGGLPADRLLAEGDAVQHYLTRDFTAKPEPMDVVFGEQPGFYQAAAGAQFTLTLSARKEAP